MNYTIIAKYLGDITKKIVDGIVFVHQFEARGLDGNATSHFGKLAIEKNEILKSVKLNKNEIYEIVYEDKPLMNEGFLIGKIISARPYVETINKEDSLDKQNNKVSSKTGNNFKSDTTNIIISIVNFTVKEFKKIDSRPDWEHWVVGYSSSNHAPTNTKRCIVMKVNKEEADGIFIFCKAEQMKECINHLQNDKTDIKEKFIWIYYTR